MLGEALLAPDGVVMPVVWQSRRGGFQPHARAHRGRLRRAGGARTGERGLLRAARAGAATWAAKKNPHSEARHYFCWRADPKNST
jgi:hypothetical protein